ncbi:hypothetical protein ACS3YM_10530 [Nocardia sp. N13]|uniref:hypothetical protein n=1 Tax=Nocardioides sp. N13(2025) TaxID=3453405 RepID=UPI003F76901E
MTRSEPLAVGPYQKTGVVLLDLPASFVVVLALHACLLQGAALVNFDPLHSHPACAILSIGLFLAWFGLSRVLAGATDGAPARALPWLSLLAPAVLLCYGVAGRVVLGRDWMEWFLGGDNVRHAVLVSDLLHQGNLTYDHSEYPRAWHAFLATIWAGQGGEVDNRQVVNFLDFLAFANWALVALLAVALSGLALSFQSDLDIVGWPAGLGVALAGLMVLTPRFFADYMALGFQTSVLGALITAVAVREVISRRSSIESFFIVASCCIALSHTWQLLLPGAGLLLLNAARRVWRGCPRSGPLIVVGIVLLVVVVGSSPMLSLLRSVDASVVGSPGATAPFPWLFLVLACAALPAILAGARKGHALVLALVAIYAPSGTAVALATLLHLRLYDYYPSKLIWTTVVLALPIIAASLSRGVSRIGSLGLLAVPINVAALVFAGTVGGMAVMTPLGALMGAWSTVDSKTVLRALEAGASPDAQAVWMESSIETAVTRTLLYLYVPDRPEGAYPDRLSVEEECDALRTSVHPVVVSTHEVVETKRRYACADVTVLRIVDPAARAKLPRGSTLPAGPFRASVAS